MDFFSECEAIGDIYWKKNHEFAKPHFLFSASSNYS